MHGQRFIQSPVLASDNIVRWLNDWCSGTRLVVDYKVIPTHNTNYSFVYVIAEIRETPVIPEQRSESS